MLIDGRQDPLAGLSLAHRLATASTPQPPLHRAAAASEAVAGSPPRSSPAWWRIPSPRRPWRTRSPRPGRGARTGFSGAPQAADRRRRCRLPRAAQECWSSAGHRVALAPDGGAALAALDIGSSMWLLFELDMPGVSGDAVAKLPACATPAASCPLALAADASPQPTHAAAKPGSTRLTKPADAAQLLAAIDAARAARAAIVARAAAEPARRDADLVPSALPRRGRRDRARGDHRFAARIGRQRIPRRGGGDVPQRRQPAHRRGCATPPSAAIWRNSPNWPTRCAAAPPISAAFACARR